MQQLKNDGELVQPWKDTILNDRNIVMPVCVIHSWHLVDLDPPSFVQCTQSKQILLVEGLVPHFSYIFFTVIIVIMAAKKSKHSTDGSQCTISTMSMLSWYGDAAKQKKNSMLLLTRRQNEELEELA